MKEFIVLMAFFNALVALTIDAMLPALEVMHLELGVERYNDIQYVVGFIFIGMTIGQVFYGPLADAIGRKPALYSGLVLLIIGSLISWSAQDLTVTLMGRMLQGLGVAAPRIVCVAIIRDKFHGRDMAHVMSLVMGVFIMVPAIAPALGVLIIHLAGWRSIYLFYVFSSLCAIVWSYLRLEETLTPDHRRPFVPVQIWAGFKEAANTRLTMGYTLCSGLVFGALLGYLHSSQQVFQQYFHEGDRFAMYFGILALAIGAAFFTNSSIVRKYGMRRIIRISLSVFILNAAWFTLYAIFAEPSLIIFMLFASTALFCLGLMFGNMNALAMEPMGHMAGLASGFVGAVSSAVSLTLGIAIGQLYNDTLIPIAAGFLGLSLASYAVMRWAEKTTSRRPS